MRRAAARDLALRFDLLLDRVGGSVDAVALGPLDRAWLAGAGALGEPALRALAAIHVACAVALGAIDACVTYDERQAAATRFAGPRTITPGPDRQSVGDPEGGWAGATDGATCPTDPSRFQPNSTSQEPL